MNIKMIMATGIAVLMLGTALSGHAVPARKITRYMPTADGRTIAVTQHGDEFHHYFEADGQRFIDSGGGVLSPLSEKEFSGLSRRGAAARSEQNRLLGSKGFPTKGSPKVLVILAQFTDRAFTYDRTVFTAMMTADDFSVQGASGSASKYYVENSLGQFDPQFEVFGPVTLSNPRAYYGGNDTYGNDKNPHEMIIEACRALDDDIDFSQYDTDGDGVVDNVYVFYAGYGENDGGGASSVWPHSSALSNRGAALTLDGVSINPYSCSNELMNGYGSTLCGIGTFCHEFTHVLGFPDLYATVYGSDADNWTPDCWTIMDQGSYNNDGKTPPYYTAYERSFMGWLDLLDLNESRTVLPPLQENMAYRVSTGNPDEYYILEYRNRTGWDSYLPGKGMVVWHIDYDKDIWDANTVNNTPTHQRVSLVCADGRWADNERAGVPFPGSSNTTSLANWPHFGNSAPAFTLSAISESNGYITLTAGSGSAIPSAPADITVSNIRDKQFEITVGSDLSMAQSAMLVTVRDASGRGVENWINRRVNLVNGSLAIDRLAPSTSYTVTLCRLSDANAISYPLQAGPYITDEPGISFYRVEGIGSEWLTDGTLVFNWTPLDKANEYFVNLFTLEKGNTLGDTADFADGLENLPAGWSTTIQNTFSVAGYFGADKPAAVFDASGQYIATCDYNREAESFSMWCRGRNIAPNGAALNISGKVNGVWVSLLRLEDLNNTARVVSLGKDELRGATALRLEYTVVSGTPRLVVDDITVGFGNAYDRAYIVEHYSVGSACSYQPAQLEPGKKYYFTVTGSDGNEESIESEQHEFVYGTPSGVENVESYDAAFFVIGRELIATGSLSVYDLAGKLVCALSKGQSVNLAQGTYIVRTATHSYVIYIK